MSLVELITTLACDSHRAIIVTDGVLDEPGPRIQYVNPAFEQMTGYASTEVLGRSPRFLQGPETSLAARKAISHHLRKGRVYRATLINYRKSGESYRCQIDIFPIRSDGGVLIAAVGIATEAARRPGRRPGRS